MIQKLLLIFSGIIVGFIASYFTATYTSFGNQNTITEIPVSIPFLPRGHEVIGFLPYWLLERAKNDYSNYITNLIYFDLTIGPDGKIVKLSNPQEAEPGWHALDSGKVQPFLEIAIAKKIPLSLAVFAGTPDTIGALVSNPVVNANNLVEDITPIMKQYNFTSLNLDVELTSEASREAQVNFASFTKELKRGLDTNKLGTLTIDVSPGSFAGKNLVVPSDISSFVDKIIVMAYDYHFPGSYVTGPVAPIGGFGQTSEFDIKTAIDLAKKTMSGNKLILGTPLYGYEWETIDNFARAATVPESGIVASASRSAELIKSCANCNLKTDDVAKEDYVIFQDMASGLYHQIFYPDAISTTEKVDFVKSSGLGGIALWALGYEDNTILESVAKYK